MTACVMLRLGFVETIALPGNMCLDDAALRITDHGLRIHAHG